MSVAAVAGQRLHSHSTVLVRLLSLGSLLRSPMLLCLSIVKAKILNDFLYDVLRPAILRQQVYVVPVWGQADQIFAAKHCLATQSDGHFCWTVAYLCLFVCRNSAHGNVCGGAAVGATTGEWRFRFSWSRAQQIYWHRLTGFQSHLSSNLQFMGNLTSGTTVKTHRGAAENVLVMCHFLSWFVVVTSFITQSSHHYFLFLIKKIVEKYLL